MHMDNSRINWIIVQLMMPDDDQYIKLPYYLFIDVIEAIQSFHKYPYSWWRIKRICNVPDTRGMEGNGWTIFQFQV